MKILGLDTVLAGAIMATCFLAVLATYDLPLPLKVGITLAAVLIAEAVAQNYIKKRGS